MAKGRELKGRIKSVENTRKITRTMEMVATSKMKRAVDRVVAARPYARALADVIASLYSPDLAERFPLLRQPAREGRAAVILLTSNRGLAGAFNSAIVRLAREHIARLQAEGKEVKIMTVGRKATDQLRRLYGDRSVGTFEVGGNPSLAVAEAVAAKIRELFAEGAVDTVTLYYSHFKSVVTQTPTAKQLIPAEIAAGAKPIDLKGAVYEYEPDEETILEELLPRNITTQVFAAMLENQAGFFAAQMTAMDNATRNAGDRIASLTLQYNRSRQAQITKELIEIISGAEAL